MKTIEERFWSKVNKTDTCWLWTASVGSHGYGQFKFGAGPRLVHRISYEWAYETIPEGFLVDHKCHEKLCVQPRHLRLATTKQNGENRGVLDGHNTSGVRGVFWNKSQGKWQARVNHFGKQRHAGFFTDLKDAEAAAIAKRNELFTHNEKDK